MTTPRTLATLRRRLALAELDLLRQVCAEQAAHIEALEARMQRAERQVDEAERMADFWQSQVADLADHLPPGAHLGITQDGALGIVHAAH